MAEEIFSVVFLTQLLSAGVRLAAPLFLAACGEVFAERAGVLNIGVEGTMLVGAIAGFATAHSTGSLPAGLAAAALSGVLVGLLFALLTVSVGTNQVVTGLAFLLLAAGVSGYAYRVLFEGSMVLPQVATFDTFAIPLVERIPILGEVLFEHDPLTYGAILLGPVAAVVVFRTPFGLRLSAVGEDPDVADAAGVNVSRFRYVALLIGGTLGGLAGAHIVLVSVGVFSENMIGGRGFIAIALVIFGRWNPMLVFGGAFLFGVIDSLQNRLQLIDVDVPSQALIVLPYVLTLAALVISGGRREGPTALSVHWSRQ